MVAWESGFTGEEVCPVWAPEGELAQHVSSDTILGIKNYFYATGDTVFLKEAWELISGVADFWVSRVVQAPDQSYHIYGVIPPDESAINVTDSVFTNVGAILALQFASEAGTILNQPVDSQ